MRDGGIEAAAAVVWDSKGHAARWRTLSPSVRRLRISDLRASLVALRDAPGARAVDQLAQAIDGGDPRVPEYRETARTTAADQIRRVLDALLGGEEAAEAEIFRLVAVDMAAYAEIKATSDAAAEQRADDE
jgi:hypothetical protein